MKREREMRGCTCKGQVLCRQCQALADRAGGRGRGAWESSAFQLSEKAFMAAIVKLATAQGWKVFHPFDSRKSMPGYPDLTMAHAPIRQLPEGSLLMAELKIDGEKPTIEQQAWLDVLQTITGIQCFVWRPSDWNVIEATLTFV